MKKILIIGVNGYLGSKLFFYLKNNSKLQVDGVDNMLYGNISLKSEKTPYFRKIDIRDLSIYDLEKYDVVICLSGLSNNPVNKKNERKIYNIPKIYTGEIADKISKIGNKLIFPSSCSVYGYNRSICNENTKVNPITHYSTNKYETEKILRKKKLNCIILRPATVFGISPSIRFDLVINMLIGMSIVNKKILLNSDGQAQRPFVYIDDLCKIFEKSIFYNNESFSLFNAGNNYFNFSIIDVAKKISKISNQEILFSENLKKIHRDDLIKNSKDERSYNVSFNHAAKELNLKYKNNFNYCLKETYDQIYETLKKNNFNSKNFYRLNKIKYLINKKYLNENNLRVKI